MILLGHDPRSDIILLGCRTAIIYFRTWTDVFSVRLVSDDIVLWGVSAVITSYIISWFIPDVLLWWRYGMCFIMTCVWYVFAMRWICVFNHDEIVVSSYDVDLDFLLL